MLLVCNGVKDRTMLSLILSAQRLGQNVVPVMEKYSEFEALLALADAQGVAPEARRARAPVDARLRALGRVRRLPLQVRPVRAGARALVAELERRGRREAWRCCTSTSAARSPTSRCSSRPSRRSRRSTHR
jgi:hypothetical protein